MKKSFFVYLLLFTTYFGYSQSFQATVSSNPVSVGEKFQISFTLNSDGSSFKAPSFKGFQVLSGPGQSSSTSIVNGKISRSFTLSYILAATKEGTYTIGPASVIAGGKSVQSNSITMKVLPESEAQKQQKQQAANQEKDLSQQARQVIAKNLYIRLSVDKSTVYQGEAVKVVYKLYRNPELNLLSLNPKKTPTFDGFWAQEFDKKNYQWQWEIVNGMRFQTAIVKEVILLPQQSGKLKIEPYEWDCTARLQVTNRQSRSRSMFDDFFDDPFFGGSNYKDFEQMIASGSSTINVKALPANKPSSFTGGVGNIKMDAWLDNTKGLTNEPITLKIKVYGTGNLKIIGQPQVKFPNDFEQYDPKISDNTSVTSSGISGNISYEYLAIPRNQGKFSFGPVEFSYFDLTTKQYKTIKSNIFKVIIGKGSGSSKAEFSNSANKEDIQLLGQDISFIKTRSHLEKNPKSFFVSPFYWILIALVPIFFIFILIWRKKNEENLKNTALKFKRKAGDTAKKRLSKAKIHLSNSDVKDFYTEVAAALWGYTADKLMLTKSELSKEKICDLLQKNGIEQELAIKVIQTIDECEFARYAPISDSEKDMQKTYSEAEKVIIDLENASNSRRIR